jgi:CRP-like cAMP-binding protein
MIDKNATYFLQSLPFFAGLPESDIVALCQSAQVRDFDKGQLIFIRGDRAASFFIIMNGWVEIYRDTHEGKEAVLGLFTRTDTFGEAVVFEGADYPYGAQAVEKTKLIAVPAAALKERAKDNPAILVRMMQSLSQHLNRAQLENEHLAQMSAPQRVGCLLLQLSIGTHGDSRVVHFPYDKSLAATKLGMKAETFSRALSQLKNIGVNIKSDEIHIADFNGLVQFCCSDCSAERADCPYSQSAGSCTGKQDCRECCAVKEAIAH